jgi:NDP-sugar pyrophosphorylase family protein
LNAMVLAAGRGTRLGDVGLKRPKILVDIDGRPLLSRQLDYLARQGVDRVVVNAHHLSEAIEDFALAYRGAPKLEVIRESELLGTAGGVRNALRLLGAEPFLVLYGDVLIDEQVTPIIDLHSTTHAAAVITVYESWDVHGKGTVELNNDGRVVSFREKSSDVPVPAWINAGVYLIEPELLGQIALGARADFGRDVFPQALERGIHVYAHKLKQPVIDIGTPNALAAARALYATSLRPGTS